MSPIQSRGSLPHFRFVKQDQRQIAGKSSFARMSLCSCRRFQLGFLSAKQCADHKSCVAILPGENPYFRGYDFTARKIEPTEAAGEHRVDIVCEMFACKNLKNDVSLLASNGRIAVIGSRGQATFSPAELFGGEKRIQGVAVFSSSEEEYAAMAAALDKGAAAGWLRPVIAHEFPMAEAAAAHSEVVKHTQGTAGKLILSV